MKIILAQQNYHIGNFDWNTQKIISAIEDAKAQQADLIVFSELCVSGYPPRDFLEFDDFINQCQDAVERICKASKNIAVLVGVPIRNPKAEGKDLLNVAYFIENQQIQQIIAKTLLPTYDIFDEYRYFESAEQWNVVHFKNTKIAVSICEDIWDLNPNPLYKHNPMDMLIKQEPDLMINLSASPFDYIHALKRKEILNANVSKYQIPILYCNTVGAQTEIIFDGGSVAMNADGRIIAELSYFEEAYCSLHWDGKALYTEQTANPSEPNEMPAQHPITRLNAQYNSAAIYQALCMGIKDYFQKMGFKKAIVASSGGIDSAVVLSLACHALGSENVQALLMPSAFSSEHSVSDAVQLSKNLQNPYEIISIKTIFDTYEQALSKVFEGLAFSVAEENLQSRIRGSLVMAMSNKFGSILLNTSNKSELATGYGTLYGDMAGGLSVIGDLYKTQVYALAHYINQKKEIIPQAIIDKAPSAELRPGQKDSDSLPDYAILDQIIYQYIERRKGPKELLQAGFDEALVKRILKLVNTNEYKRNQFCPILRVSPKAFGVGRRMPIVGKYLS